MNNTLERTSYIRDTYKKYPIKELGLGIEIYTDENSITALGFRGKAKKPAFHYRFRSVERMQEYITEFIETTRQREYDKANAKIEREQKKTDFFNSLKVGDTFICSWGYDQTNIDFYEIVEKKNKSVVIRGITKLRRDGEHMTYDYVTPHPPRAGGEYTTEPMLKVPQDGHITISSFQWAYLWDGRDRTETAFGFGH